MDKVIELKNIPVLFGLEPMDIQNNVIAYDAYLIRLVEEYINDHLSDFLKEAFVGKYMFRFKNNEDILWKIVYLDNEYRKLFFVGTFNDGQEGQDRIWVIK